MSRIHCSMACTASASLRELSGLKERVVCVEQVQLDDFEQLAGKGTEE